MNDKTVVQILGPTGVGKTRMALSVARKFSGEVISADAMQVYAGFDIGTDKLPPAQRQDIKHHLIDIIHDCSRFNAARFLEMAHDISEKILKRGHMPLVCGGTALYLRAMIKGLFPQNDRQRVSREKLEELAASRGLEYLWSRLQRIDPQYAGRIGKRDRKRIVRGLEIYYNQGKPPSRMFALTRTPFRDYRIIRVGLNMERQRLYQRINARVDRMMREGLISEVERLSEVKPPDCPPFEAVGYREILLYLRGELSRADAVTLIKQRSRNFAKRQLSWFRQESDISWFSPDDEAGVASHIERYRLPEEKREGG